jgi:hypothetical protein
MMLFVGFSNLALDEQMQLLQNTWLDVMCMNLAFRSVPYRGLIVFADDFKITEENAARLSLPANLMRSFVAWLANSPTFV